MNGPVSLMDTMNEARWSSLEVLPGPIEGENPESAPEYGRNPAMSRLGTERPRILETLAIEELAIDGMCGVY
jgi:mycofactocin precursor